VDFAVYILGVIGADVALAYYLLAVAPINTQTGVNTPPRPWETVCGCGDADIVVVCLLCG
jgi:hypothetical protein